MAPHRDRAPSYIRADLFGETGMPRFLSIALLLAVSSALDVVATAPVEAQVPAGAPKAAAVPMPTPLDTTGMFRAAFARVGDDLFIAGQPTEAALRALKAKGVTTVVNLRTPSEMANRQAVPFDEAALLKELGIEYVYLPVRGDEAFPYTPSTVHAFAKALDGAKGKVLLHCTIAWRASHLWSAYLVQHKGMSVEEALKHGQAINLMGYHGGNGRQPVEHFLGRDLPELRRLGRRG